MYEQKTVDFFPELSDEEAELVALGTVYSGQDTDEDRLHEAYLKGIETQLNAESGPAADDDWGELPYDEEADRKRWDTLEKDFDRVFNELNQ